MCVVVSAAAVSHLCCALLERKEREKVLRCIVPCAGQPCRRTLVRPEPSTTSTSARVVCCRCWWCGVRIRRTRLLKKKKILALSSCGNRRNRLNNDHLQGSVHPRRRVLDHAEAGQVHRVLEQKVSGVFFLSLFVCSLCLILPTERSEGCEEVQHRLLPLSFDPDFLVSPFPRVLFCFLFFDR